MSDALVSIAGSNLLYQVVGGTQELLSSGPFEISSTSEGEDDRDAIIVAKVSERFFTLERNMPCLMTDEHTYTFAIHKSSGPATFYCLILSKDHATTGDIELLQTILSASTAFSGPSQEGDEAGGPAGEAEGEKPGAWLGSLGSFSSSPSLLKVTDGIRAGGSILGSQLMKAASFAQEKAGAVLTDERKQQIKENASSVAASVAAGARKVAEVSKSASVKVYETVRESELAAKISAGTRSALSVVYSEMQRASVVVVALVKEAAGKATRAAGGEQRSTAPAFPQST